MQEISIYKSFTKKQLVFLIIGKGTFSYSPFYNEFILKSNIHYSNCRF